MLFKVLQSIVILGSLGTASADIFADFFGIHWGPETYTTGTGFPASYPTGFPTSFLSGAPTGFPTGTASSGFAPVPTAIAARKLKVRYNLAPTSEPFAVPEPTSYPAWHKHQEGFGTTGLGTGTAGPTGTGFPFPTTFATMWKPHPTPRAVVEARADEATGGLLDTFRRWIAGEQTEADI